MISVTPVPIHRTPSVAFLSLPQGSDPTVAIIQPGTVETMYYHEHQTDQLTCVEGRMVLILLVDGKLEYHLLDAAKPETFVIPPLVPHSAYNPGPTNCVIFNTRVPHRHNEKDLHEATPPPFDYTTIQKLLV
ncbi:MAG: cupin domain-containing protein [Stenomitos frigidus ULC029]